MSNGRTWDILVLKGESESVSIFTSFISDFILGVNTDSKSSKVCLSENAKENVENLLSQWQQKLKLHITWEVVEDANWHLAWKDNFTPVKVDDKIVVVPDWDTNVYDCKHVIKIKPGMAFGTGHHETTFLMLESMLVYMQKGMSVIDIGTGSGILAIASHQLGASDVLGTEFDPVCEENFNENLKLNNIESNVSYVPTNCLKWTDYSQDIILANINRNVIIDLLPKLKNSHGTIIISGVLITDEVVISKLCNDLNLSVISRKTKGEWMCLTLRKQCK